MKSIVNDDETVSSKGATEEAAEEDVSVCSKAYSSPFAMRAAEGHWARQTVHLKCLTSPVARNLSSCLMSTLEVMESENGPSSVFSERLPFLVANEPRGQTVAYGCLIN